MSAATALLKLLVAFGEKWQVAFFAQRDDSVQMTDSNGRFAAAIAVCEESISNEVIPPAELACDRRLVRLP